MLKGESRGKRGMLKREILTWLQWSRSHQRSSSCVASVYHRVSSVSLCPCLSISYKINSPVYQPCLSICVLAYLNPKPTFNHIISDKINFGTLTYLCDLIVILYQVMWTRTKMSNVSKIYVRALWCPCGWLLDWFWQCSVYSSMS